MRQIHIIGGGLAGLTLGIFLRREGVPVSVVEAGQYPRHRVCGEFISGQGRRVLQELGFEDELFAIGACEARTAAFYSEKSESAPRLLPDTALRVSRYVLDGFLAKKFCDAGGKLRTGERWRGHYEAGVVRATGHRNAPVKGVWRWFGLKAHARGINLEADLEMHLVDNGYVGLCRLDPEKVNVCGLFRSREATPGLTGNWRRWLQGKDSSVLRRRLENAIYEEDTFCATAGLDLNARRAKGLPECPIGDAFTMIAPITGNGMSMALESARVAAGELIKYSRGTANWEEARKKIANQCDRAFRRRLFWGKQFQRTAFVRGWSDTAVWLGTHSSLLWRELFRRTR